MSRSVNWEEPSIKGSILKIRSITKIAFDKYISGERNLSNNAFVFKKHNITVTINVYDDTTYLINVVDKNKGISLRHTYNTKLNKSTSQYECWPELIDALIVLNRLED